MSSPVTPTQAELPLTPEVVIKDLEGGSSTIATEDLDSTLGQGVSGDEAEDPALVAPATPKPSVSAVSTRIGRFAERKVHERKGNTHAELQKRVEDQEASSYAGDVGAEDRLALVAPEANMSAPIIGDGDQDESKAVLDTLHRFNAVVGTPTPKPTVAPPVPSRPQGGSARASDTGRKSKEEKAKALEASILRILSGPAIASLISGAVDDALVSRESEAQADINRLNVKIAEMEKTIARLDNTIQGAQRSVAEMRSSLKTTSLRMSGVEGAVQESSSNSENMVTELLNAFEARLESVDNDLYSLIDRVDEMQSASPEEMKKATASLKTAIERNREAEHDLQAASIVARRASYVRPPAAPSRVAPAPSESSARFSSVSRAPTVAPAASNELVSSLEDQLAHLKRNGLTGTRYQALLKKLEEERESSGSKGKGVAR